LTVAAYPIPIVPGRTGATRLFDRALALIPLESHQAGSLLACYGIALGLEEADYAKATEALQRALAIAQHEQDSTLELWTLTYGAVVDGYHLHWLEALRQDRQAAQLARQSDEPLAAAFVRHFWAVLASLALGDLPGAIQKAPAGLAVAERVRDCNSLSGMFWSNEFVSELQGNWEAARHYSDRGLVVAPSDQRLLGTRAVLEYQVGEFGQGEVYLRQLLESVLLTPPGPNFSYATQAIVIPVVAQISGIANRLDAAEAAAQAVLSAPSATPLFAKFARTGLALLAQLRGDRVAARELYDVLASRRGTMSSFLIADDRLLGLLATTQGQLDQAMVHFEDALAFCRQAGYRPELAWTCYDYAGALLQRDHPGDHARAMSLLEESLTIACELGMRPLAERVTILQQQSQPQSLTVAYPDGLSQREVEVLCLVAQGKSNPELAAELSISLNTVTRHLNHIFAKIGTNNRTEAAVYAIQQGLL
jgi:DNA-binding CsgD family transcriptional regulator